MLLLNVVTMLFGSNQVLIKGLESEDATSGAVDSCLCMLLRFSIAALALGVSIAVSKAFAAARSAEQKAAPGKEDKETDLWAGALELSVWLFMGFFAQAVGLQYTTASAGALLGSLTVVVVPLLSLTDGRPIAQTTWASVALAMMGTLLFVGPGALQGAGGGVGDGLELISAFFFAVQLWRCEKVARDLPEHRISELTCLQLGIVAVISLVAALAEGWSLPGLVTTMSGWPASEWVQVLVMALVTTAFCLWAEARALRDVDAAPAALVYACEPVWGAAFAFLWRGEVPDGPLAVAGSVLLLFASMGAAAGAGAAPAVDDESIAGQNTVTAAS